MAQLLLLLLTGQFNRAHTTHCDPVGPFKWWQRRGGDVGAVLRVLAFGCVRTPAERLQSHCARLTLQFSQLTDLCHSLTAQPKWNLIFPSCSRCSLF